MLYSLNSLLIAGILLFSMLVAIEAGHRIGRIFRPSASEPYKSQVNAVQASLLGVLALVLGFTFSLALQRFDSRSEALTDEANAIGTAYLRAQLLPDPVRSGVHKLLRDYLDLRLQEGQVSLADDAQRRILLLRAKRLQETLWQHAMQAAEIDNGVVTTGLFIQSLNEAIDSFGRRDDELRRHIPEEILLLLFLTFVVTGGVVGYSSGLSGHRPPLVVYIMVLLIVVLTFIIIDLDRPRRGLVTIDQDSLLELKASFSGK
ncbi:MAG: hypothetical protein HXY27_00890 [Hydrogenophilaceae bacterium]|nr:hypothetical protein [Hydrogenophilaceae bacterium]